MWWLQDKEGRFRKKPRHPEAFFTEVVNEMIWFQLRGSSSTECCVDVKIVRTKFQCATESFLAFSHEVKNVIYHGNISTLYSMTIKTAAFCGSNSFSRSYGKSVVKAVERARLQSKHFDSAADDLYPVCKRQIWNAAESLSKSGSSMVDNASSCGDSIVSCADSAGESLGTSLMHISDALWSGLGAVVSLAQGIDITRIKRVFEDVLKMLVKLRNINALLVEKMVSLQQQASDLTESSVDGYFICSTMDSMYVKLREMRKILDSVLPQLLLCVELSILEKYIQSICQF